MFLSARSTDRVLLRRVFYNRREVRSGWRLLIFLAIVTALIVSSNLAIGRLLPRADQITLTIVYLVVSILVFQLASWIMGRLEGRALADYGLPWRLMFRSQFWQGMLFGFGALTGQLVAMRLAGVFSFGTVALPGIDLVKWAVIWALVFFLVALREEFLARGYGLYTIAAGLGFWPAAIISAFLFGFAHRNNSGENWIGLVNVGLFGLLACLMLRRTGNLWLPIGFHLSFDWGETYFYGVADSGNTLPGHLLNASSSGPVWLSGGTVGPEGSVLCTLLLIVVGVICAVWLREVKYPKPESGEAPTSPSPSNPSGPPSPLPPLRSNEERPIA